MQNFKKKWKLSLIFTLLPVLLYGILGPLEIYAGNADEFDFILKDFFFFFFIGSVLLWLVGSAVLASLPKKAGDVLHVVIFIFSVLSYVQNLFLNSKLMNMNGSAMDWESMRGMMATNLIIWIVLAVVFAVIPFVFKNQYQKIYLGITAFISAVQLVTIVSLLVTTVPIRYSERILSVEGRLAVAPNSNVIVLLLDSVYNTQFEETMAIHPEIAESLKDFTYYDNTDCHYFYTYPSLAHMMTGTEFDCDMPPEEWKESSWHEERSVNFYNLLHELNYECDYYGEDDYAVGSPTNLVGIIDNTVISSSPMIDHRLLYVELEKMAIYKYVPYILKPRFEVHDNVLKDIAYFEERVNVWEDGGLYQELKEEGLSVDVSLNNKFFVLHLQGFHYPLHTNADGTLSEETTSLSETSEGNAVIIQEYIEQLKNLGGGIYDNALIIITADHGIDRNTPQPIYFIKPPHTSQEEMQVTSAPISHDDFQATVLTCIGQDSTGYGTSVFDWKDGDQRTRECWFPEDWDTVGSVFKPRGYYIYTYNTDRYELMELPDEAGIYVPCH
ncbi:MAG: LTA synthase family protein [Lachnospiraceae bacterium]|nr:LTA synthase family protein [Lachnospiraceae bacterium]